VGKPIRPGQAQSDLFEDPRPTGLATNVQSQAERVIEHLRAWHRELSEQVVECNRELARLAASVPSNALHTDATIVATRKHRDELHAKRDAVEQDLGRELQALKDVRFKGFEAETVKGFDPIDGKTEGEEGQPERGLIRQRHPNRDFFLADLFDYALKDDGASMEAPIFTLATRPDLSVWKWRSKDGSKSVKVTPSVLGRATQHDKDVLIYVVSQMVEGLNRDREDANRRTVRFTVYDFLVTTNRQTSGDGYRRLHEAFERLRGTSISTDIKTGGTRVKEGFGIIDKWKIIEKSPTDDRMVAVEVTLSDWLYNAVQAFEVLTIHPDYFRLRKPLARRLYEIARKHCGHQTKWVIGLTLLQEKTGSKSTLKEFRRAVRAVQDDDSLPEYRLVLSLDDKVTFHVRDPQRLALGLSQ